MNPGDLIVPETKVSELLEAHPELEETLVGLAPAFSALRNPVLRRTVARVATLAQAARMASKPVAEIVNPLRRALGQPPLLTVLDAPDSVPSPRPTWVAGASPAVVLDADGLLGEGKSPVAEVTSTLSNLESGGIVRLDASFRPSPMIDALERKGHGVFCEPDGQAWVLWIKKADSPSGDTPS